MLDATSVDDGKFVEMKDHYSFFINNKTSQVACTNTIVLNNYEQISLQQLHKCNKNKAKTLLKCLLYLSFCRRGVKKTNLADFFL